MLKKFVTGLATGTLFLNSVGLMLAADTTILVQGNGSDSTTTIGVNHDCNQTTEQTNKTKVSLDIKAKGNTGANEIDGTTGTGASINTGKVTNNVGITVTGGDNTAEVPTCCCGENGSLSDITVMGNGTGTTQAITDSNTNTTMTTQKTRTRVRARVRVKGKTGKNKITDTTGGTADITTDDVSNTVTATVNGGFNTL